MNTPSSIGLTQKQAESRLKEHGYNEIPSQKSRNALHIFISVLSEPMLLLLIASGGIYSLLGEFKDALILLSSVFVIIGITFYQERRTERTLEALKDLSSPRALVVRDGVQIRIPGKDVTVDDLIILMEGDRVPADAAVISCENLSVDESLLTGESMPVRKIPWDEVSAIDKPGGDDLPFVYSGTLVTGGRGYARVISIGSKTEIGKIGKSLESIKNEKTPLHKETSVIVKSVATIGIALCIIIVLAFFFLKGDLIGGLLTGLTLGMAILPEEFPVVLIVFLTIGAWRISKKNVLTRRSAAIETLGSATILCSDKTGTITLNKMELSYIFAGGRFWEISNATITDHPKEVKTLLGVSVMASKIDPFDSIEKEIIKTANTHLNEQEQIPSSTVLEREYPLTRELLAVTHAWKREDGRYDIATKGAPEAILKLCRANHEQTKATMQSVKEMSEKGLRILGVARATHDKSGLPDHPSEFAFEFVGLLGFIDPPRASIPKSIREAYSAGMRVIMITGDYPGTASFIAKEVGIKAPDQYITGDELSTMSEHQLRERIKTVNIFSRVVPEQKLLIVNALKANGEIVAMTGDGVNDAPALKAAHIGIAMGERGTDVAREASSLVLLNDDFSSIVSAVRLGRRIYDNLKHAMSYILTVHVPIAGISVLPIFFDLPNVLLPVHIVFLEFIIDPACSIVFESRKEDRDIMKRPPRNPKSSLFNRKTVLVSLAEGLGALAVSFGLYYFSIQTTGNEELARSLGFSSLVISNITLILSNLSWKESILTALRSKNKALFIVSAGALSALLCAIYIPQVADVFKIAPLGPIDLLILCGSALITLLWFELMKQLNREGTASVSIQ